MSKHHQKARSKAKRRAISPVIATVILIAITLIAAVAIGGFVFGIFGSFTKSAQVSVVSVTYSSSGSTWGTLTIVLSNTGTANTQTTTSGTISYGGSSYPLSCTASSTGTTTAVITPGATVTLTCTASTTAPPPGAQFVGSVSLANGEAAQFSGSF